MGIIILRTLDHAQIAKVHIDGAALYYIVANRMPATSNQDACTWQAACVGIAPNRRRRCAGDQVTLFRSLPPCLVRVTGPKMAPRAGPNGCKGSQVTGGNARILIVCVAAVLAN